MEDWFMLQNIVSSDEKTALLHLRDPVSFYLIWGRFVITLEANDLLDLRERFSRHEGEATTAEDFVG